MKAVRQGNKREIKFPRDRRPNLHSIGANKVRKTGGQSPKVRGTRSDTSACKIMLEFLLT